MRRRRNQFGRGTVGGLGILVLAAAVTATPASAAPIEIAGATLGCFGASCTPSSGAVTNGAYGLTFTPSVFDIFTDISGTALIPFGTFSRTNVNVSDTMAPLLFTLQVNLTGPTALSLVPVPAVIRGTTPGGGGPLFVDFSSGGFTLPFESGSLIFSGVTDAAIAKNSSTAVFSAVQDPPLAAVPEPSALLLLGSGLLGLARLTPVRARLGSE